jgi:hypothetical protein
MVNVADTTTGVFARFNPPTVPKIGRPEVRVAFGASLRSGDFRISVAGPPAAGGPFSLSTVVTGAPGFEIDQGQYYGVSDFGQIAFKVRSPGVEEIWRGDRFGGISSIDWDSSGRPVYGPLAINMLGGVAFVKTLPSGESALMLTDFRAAARMVLRTGDPVVGSADRWVPETMLGGLHGFEPLLNDMNQVAANGGAGGAPGFFSPTRDRDIRRARNMVPDAPTSGWVFGNGKIGVRGQVAYSITRADGVSRIELSDGRTARDRSSGLAPAFDPQQMVIGGIDRNGTVVYYHVAGTAAFAHDGVTLTRIADTTSPIVPGLILNRIVHVTINRTGTFSILGNHVSDKSIFVGSRTVPMRRLFGTGDLLNGSRIRDFRVIDPTYTNASYLGERRGMNHLAFAYALENGVEGIEYMEFV